MKEKLKQLPQKPGVYMMRDSLGNTIYVGKAKNLKNRVSQYFYHQKDRDPKVAEMIQHIHSFNYQVTDTELDALIEECRFIKEIKPRYNRQMKNVKRYLYIKIPTEHYPKVMVVNEKTEDDAVYYGPFTSQNQVEQAVQYMYDFYPIRKCTSSRLVKRVNGCLFRELGTCLGVCTGKIRPEEYWMYIEKIQQLLNGNSKDTVQGLLKKLDTAIENLQFEKAAKYREYYRGLRHVIGKQQLVQSSNKNRTILVVEFIDDTRLKLFLIKGNMLLYGKILDRAKSDNEMRLYLNKVIRDKLLVTKEKTRNGLTPEDLDEAQIIYSYLKRNRNRVLCFWIPSTHLKNETSLDATVLKIVTRIGSFNLGKI